MFHTVIVGTMTFAFFIFINIAAVFIPPGDASSPLASTVGFFQLVADMAFMAGIGYVGYRVIRKLGNTVPGKAAVAQSLQPSYQYEPTPLNPRNKEWTAIDTKPMPPITDAQIQGVQLPAMQRNFPITPHPAQHYVVTQIQPATQHEDYRQNVR
jgi:hypothetical protein